VTCSGRGAVVDFARNGGFGSAFLAIWDSGFWRFVGFVGGSLRWGTRWQSHETIVRRTCCGQRWRTSSTTAIAGCSWRARSLGGFSTAALPGVCARDRQPGLPTRLVAGLLILKHMHDLSDEVLCARWLENPCYQFQLSFCHRLPFDRSSLTHCR
jgi:hypothetical protein